jgi:hypothetical protein
LSLVFATTQPHLPFLPASFPWPWLLFRKAAEPLLPVSYRASKGAVAIFFLFGFYCALFGSLTSAPGTGLEGYVTLT